MRETRKMSGRGGKQYSTYVLSLFSALASRILLPKIGKDTPQASFAFQGDRLTALLIELGDDIRFVLAIEFRIEIGETEVLHHGLDRCGAINPVQTNVCPVADAHGIDADDGLGSFIINDAN